MKELKPGKPFAIFDLDGCLFDDAWRLNRINWKERDFRYYHDSMVGDTRVTAAGGALLSIIVNIGHPIIFLTAGPQSHEKENISRIQRLTGLEPGEYFIMFRKEDEEGMPSADLKEYMWNLLAINHGLSAEDCIIAVDDHWGVVERYAKLGLSSFVCNSNQFIWSKSDAFKQIQEGCKKAKANCEYISGIDVIIPGIGCDEGSKNRIRRQSVLNSLVNRLSQVCGHSSRSFRLIKKPNNHGNRSDNRDIPSLNVYNSKCTQQKLVDDLGKEFLKNRESAENILSKMEVENSPYYKVEWEGNQDGKHGHYRIDNIEYLDHKNPSVEQHADKGENKDSCWQQTTTHRRLPTKNAGDVLAEAAETFKERNAMYKDNAFIHSKIMAAMFPNGVTLKTEEDYHMWHLFELVIVKLSRFANSGLKHQDSIRDLSVYAAMCETLVDCHDIFENKP